MPIFRKFSTVIEKKLGHSKENPTPAPDQVPESPAISIQQKTTAAKALGIYRSAPAKHLLSKEAKETLLNTLQDRFEKNPKRHKKIKWTSVLARLKEAPQKKLWSLNEMEATGGDPDVVGFDKTTGEYIFEDRSPESPFGRRNIVYDKKAEDWLGANYPDEKGAGVALRGR